MAQCQCSRVAFNPTQDAVTSAHGANKFIKKRKRLHNLVKEAQKEQAPGKRRRVKLLRRTRFNSCEAVSESFLANLPVVRSIVDTPAWKNIVQGSKAKKGLHHEKAWSSKPREDRGRTVLEARLTKGLPILKTLATFSRALGGSRLPESFPIWRATIEELERVWKKADFVDVSRRDTEAQRQQRRKDMETAVRFREENHVTRIAKAAMVFDPRWLSVVGMPTEPKWLQQALQEARCAASTLWPDIRTVQGKN